MVAFASPKRAKCLTLEGLSWTPLKPASFVHRSEINTEPWPVHNWLGYPEYTVDQVITKACQIPITVCLYVAPFLSRNVAAENRVAVSTTCSTASHSRNMMSAGGHLQTQDSHL